MGMQLIGAEDGTVAQDYPDMSIERLFAISYSGLYSVYNVKGEKINMCEPKLKTKHWQETKGGKKKYRHGKSRDGHVPGICAHYLRRLEAAALETRMQDRVLVGVG